MIHPMISSMVSSFFLSSVGNSQLESFVRKEIREYEFAFKEMNCTATLTVIVVQKRIS